MAFDAFELFCSIFNLLFAEINNFISLLLIDREGELCHLAFL